MPPWSGRSAEGWTGSRWRSSSRRRACGRCRSRRSPRGPGKDRGSWRTRGAGPRRAPVRQHAAQRLAESHDAEMTRDRHRDHFLEWSEGVRTSLYGPDQAYWFSRLEIEHDNLRAALDWCRARGDVEQEMRMAVAL